VDMFNRNGKILVEKLSSHVKGPEFDVTPYMTLCALDNMSGECRASRVYLTNLEVLSFKNSHIAEHTTIGVILFNPPRKV